MRNLRRFGLIVAFSVAFAGAATEPAAPLTLPQLEASISAVLRARNTPGASVAIVRTSGETWVRGFGLADVAHGRPATPDTLFRAGSISKVFAALAILQLEAQGKLRLDDPLSLHAPGLAFKNAWENTAPVRIVHLLEHTAGWDEISFGAYAADVSDRTTLTEALARQEHARVSRWRPGSRFAYTNAGATAVAYVVERLTGRRFEDYVTEQWFRRLAMPTATYFQPAPQTNATQLYRPDGATPYLYWHAIIRPSAALNASARELTGVLELLLGRGAFRGVQLLPPSAIDRMERPTSTYAAREGLLFGYGLANYASVQNGWVFHGHNGHVPGALAHLSYSAELGAGYCVMINSQNETAQGEICWLIGAYLTADRRARPNPPAVAVPPGVAAAYSGWYEPIGPNREAKRFLDRLLRHHQLAFVPSGLQWVSALTQESRDYVAVTSHQYRRGSEPVPTLALIRDPTDGTLVEIESATFRRISSARAWLEEIALLVVILLALSTLVSGLIALFRRRRHGAFDRSALALRLLPSLATLALLALVMVAVRGGYDAIDRLGRPGAVSICLFVLSLLFPALAVGAFLAAVRPRASNRRSFAWWHNFTASCALVLIAAYLAYGHAIGITTWK